MKRALPLTITLLALSGCDLVYRPEEPQMMPPQPVAAAPAPIGTPTPLVPMVPAVATGPTDSIAGQVTIAPGDSLYRIAYAHNVPPFAIVDENRLQPPYKLKVGQVLVIPRVRRYTIQPGDTIEKVSSRFNVDTPTVARLNHLMPPYALKSGLPLVLPPGSGGAVVASSVPPPGPITASPIPAPTQRPTTGSGQFNTVDLPPPGAVAAGPTPTPRPVAGSSKFDDIDLPPPGAQPEPEPKPAVRPAPVASVTSDAKPLGSQPAAAPTPAAKPVQTAAVTAPKPETPPADATSENAPTSGADHVAPEVAAVTVAGHRPPTPPLFNWPVRGAIVSGYGSTPTGGHNDGINISAKEGSEVDAAEAGVVAYAGNGVPGFGNLLLIKHPGGWITAYGHNEELLVKVGDKVRRGQAIAKVGATGRVSAPQLHFEIRHEIDQEVKPLDPLDHLPAPASDAG